MNEIHTTPLPYFCISKMCSRHSLPSPSMESSPELGKKARSEYQKNITLAC